MLVFHGFSSPGRLTTITIADVEVTCEDWSRRLDVAFEPIDSELALMSNELYWKR
jgi:hypothetical protein